MRSKLIFNGRYELFENATLHIYNEHEVDEMILLIRDSFIPAFVGLEKTLRSKLEEVKNDWE